MKKLSYILIYLFFGVVYINNNVYGQNNEKNKNDIVSNYNNNNKILRENIIENIIITEKRDLGFVGNIKISVIKYRDLNYSTDVIKNILLEYIDYGFLCISEIYNGICLNEEESEWVIRTLREIMVIEKTGNKPENKYKHTDIKIINKKNNIYIKLIYFNEYSGIRIKKRDINEIIKKIEIGLDYM